MKLPKSEVDSISKWRTIIVTRPHFTSSLGVLWLHWADQFAMRDTLEIKDVPILTDDVAMESGYLGSLENLYIGCSSECQDYVSFVVSLDRIFPALKSLHELRLYGLEEWDTLPNQLLHLTCLHFLYLHGFGIEELPGWIERLSALKSLELLNCQKLSCLPSRNFMLNLLQLFIVDCPLLKKNIASDDSERSKVAHIRYLNILS